MILVTKNPADFIELARSIPSHPGIFAIYQDNDVDRDMSYPEIVAAIQRLEETFAQAGTPLRYQVHILNHWRGAIPPPAPSAEESPPPLPSQTRGKRKKPK